MLKREMDTFGRLPSIGNGKRSALASTHAEASVAQTSPLSPSRSTHKPFQLPGLKTNVSFKFRWCHHACRRTAVNWCNERMRGQHYSQRAPPLYMHVFTSVYKRPQVRKRIPLEGKNRKERQQRVLLCVLVQTVSQQGGHLSGNFGSVDWELQTEWSLKNGVDNIHILNFCICAQFRCELHPTPHSPLIFPVQVLVAVWRSRGCRVSCNFFNKPECYTHSLGIFQFRIE